MGILAFVVIAVQVFYNSGRPAALVVVKYWLLDQLKLHYRTIFAQGPEFDTTIAGNEQSVAHEQGADYANKGNQSNLTKHFCIVMIWVTENLDRQVALLT